MLHLALSLKKLRNQAGVDPELVKLGWELGDC